ncbi:hypothetical protein QPK87_19600 [Kamptonema cortianum]|nr:hypothetical protein [Geitlerinema splendidum]MDK3158762.1 hypothetical protein [Kamptonema cortianum]
MTHSEFDADTPEGSKGYSSQYVTRKDFWIALIVLVVLGLGSIPLYRIMKSEADKTVCKKSLKSIAMSIQQYSEMYDQRFPPLYAVGDGGTPFLEKGMPIVWASVIPELGTGATYRCPSCEEEEVVRVNGRSVVNVARRKKTLDYIELSYGMYAPLSTMAITDIAYPEETVLISETSNGGARDTYNPIHFTDSEGVKSKHDGFAIGFDDSLLEPSSTTEHLTRLSFYGTSDGNFDKEGIRCRHKDHIYAVSTGGRLLQLQPHAAKFQNSGARWLTR